LGFHRKKRVGEEICLFSIHDNVLIVHYFNIARTCHVTTTSNRSLG
jgi:hypothetical protein